MLIDAFPPQIVFTIFLQLLDYNKSRQAKKLQRYYVHLKKYLYFYSKITV